MANPIAFVTGGKGFVGANLARFLVYNGADVVTLVRDTPSSKLSATRPKPITEVHGDVRDVELISRILTDYSVTHVFHLAAQALVQKALANPFDTLDTNIRGTYSVLEAVRRHSSRIEGVVVMSSDKAYGSAPVPYTEHSPLLGIYPYDASKVCTDVLARSYATTYKLPIVVARPSNIYGPGDLNESRLIRDTIVSTLAGNPVQIRSDGSPARDYLFVEDIYQGLYLAALGAEQHAGKAFNFGTGTPISVLDLVLLILDLMNRRDLEPEILGKAKAEIDIQYIDATLAKEALDWRPRYTLEDGLNLTIEWWRDRWDAEAGGQ